MSDDRWSTVLVLGGIRSGKSAFAEALVADAPSVRYVATAAGGENDPEWRARIEEHQRRRPQSWSTEETGADPAALTAVLTDAKSDDTLLVDDLGGWVAAMLDPARQPNDDLADVAALTAAVRACPARVVLVSPEVGLALVPTTPVGRAFADALGTTNQALAEACDRVALVVAGRAVWLKTEHDAEPFSAGSPVGHDPVAATAGSHLAHDPVAGTDGSPVVDEAAVAPVAVTPGPTVGSREFETRIVTPETTSAPEPSVAAVLIEPTMVLPTIDAGVAIEPGMDLPLPDTDAGPDARDRLADLDVPGTGLGSLVEAVEFAAATQVTVTPRPWSAVRVLLISGGHAGGAAAGDDPADADRRVAQVENGEGLLSRLAATAGADVAVVRVGTAGAMEDGPVLDEAAVEMALRQGWRLADAAADDGRDAIVLAAIGTGTDAVATAVIAATTGAEPVVLLPRVLVPGGRYDDEAWMSRCAAVRDALHRIRQEPRGPRDLLCQLGGPDLAVATGAVLGAAARRLPVLLDGPVGVAAAVVARELASQSRHWCLLPDAGNLALVRQGADVLGLTPVVNLGLGLGEGANALATLPLLRTAIGLAAGTPVHPALLPAPTDTTPTDPTDPPDLTDPTDHIGSGDDGDGDATSDLSESAAYVRTHLVVDNDEELDFAEPESAGPGPATTAESAPWPQDHTATEAPAGDGGADAPEDGRTAAPEDGGADAPDGRHIAAPASDGPATTAG